MATLAFSAIGSSLGASFLPTIGGLTGAALGQAAGAIAGRYVDQALFASSGQPRLLEGPRLSELEVTTSTEGKPLARVYGRTRVAGQMIWATNFEEKIITRTQSTGSSGKGGALSSGAQSKTTEYQYFANFAIAVSEGTITRLGRVWANGNDLNLAEYTYRFYTGSETQTPDSLIEAKEGANNAPAYKGVAYIVFERMPLAKFGNRIPQLNFELFRRLDDFEQSIEAIGLIPSSGEYVYEKAELTRDLTNGVTLPENTHSHQGGSDWDVSIDQLQQELINTKNVSLFVSWFGTDLRASHCQIRPAVDNREKVILGRNWSVSNETRASAHLISLTDGKASYGGTPSDETVVSAIEDLTVRGLKVTFNPFILMDIEANNLLADPYSTNLYQPKYPWRGRITVNPAPGMAATPDKTSQAISQLQPFIGSASPSDFTVTGNQVTYHGPQEWSLRRMILHYAHLCASCGGVDAFILCSELRGLTTIRDENNNFPFVNALKSLAGDIKSILGPSTKVTYGADWSEYFGHQPTDGSSDVYFHLDPLWSDDNIDAIGIDNYWPLSDWRAGTQHLDAEVHNSLYDLTYLQSNIKGGEGYDWYYASEQARENQTRTPITDGQGKPWVFRYKDIHSWWSNPHYNRPLGTENTTPTSWIPQSKPIWFVEVGCPAINLGSNQPNLFVDPKSSETGVPYFSNGNRDDYIQRRYITAMKDFFTPSSTSFEEENNPQSGIYSDRMVDPERIYVYTWDARPYPAFPANTNIWGDGENWLRGHWLNGRTGSVSLSALVKQLMIDYNFENYETPALNGIVEGYVVDHIMGARDALQALELAFFFDSFESEGQIKFRHRGQINSKITITPDQMVEKKPNESLYNLTRAQETELPRSAKINFIDGNHSYQTRSLEGQQTIGMSKRVATAELPIVMEADKAQSLASKWVQESWAAREEGVFSLPNSFLSIEPSDILKLNVEGHTIDVRVTELNDTTYRALKGRSIDPQIYDDTVATTSLPENTLPEIYGPTKAHFFDFPLLSGNEIAHQGYVGAFQSPWPGTIAFYRSPEDGNYTLNQTVDAPAKMGTLLNDLNTGPAGRWDYGNTIRIKMALGAPNSASKISVLGGENLAAIRHDNNIWEIIQFQNATLISENEYELQGLLRAQGGTDDALETIASSGADFLLIDEAIAPVNMSINEIGLSHYWRYGPAPYVIGHPSYQTKQIIYTARGLRPYSPVHLRAMNQNGDFAISWIRRSRIGGDSWELNEIPLGEQTEHYEIDILNNGTPIRTLASTSPSIIYSAGDQQIDWGSAQQSYHVRVYQRAEIYGRGGYSQAILANQ